MPAPELFRQLLTAIRDRGIRVPDEVRDMRGLIIAVRANRRLPTAPPVEMSARRHDSLTAAEAVTGYHAAGSLRLRHSVANRLLRAVRDMQPREAASALGKLGFKAGRNPNRELGRLIHDRRGDAVRASTAISLSYATDEMPVRFEAVFGR